ncbi:hypothetical protein GCM10009712_01760 [Pseudarthrobacter sulfonivorans]|uniref:hypothetical protein n=1 Tax=Pseudarthrobacter sulfonivorans TaxID=121292 RepID=UPI00168B1721|nr:hypothetical protein [Pseudarthrobacter sulfonivorans]
MIDYAITSLNVLYWAVVAIWLWLWLTTDLATTGNSIWFVVAALALMIPYHLLRRKRNKLQSRAKELQDTPK